jgi:hypothetical protein
MGLGKGSPGLLKRTGKHREAGRKIRFAVTVTCDLAVWQRRFVSVGGARFRFQFSAIQSFRFRASAHHALFR